MNFWHAYKKDHQPYGGYVYKIYNKKTGMFFSKFNSVKCHFDLSNDLSFLDFIESNYPHKFPIFYEPVFKKQKNACMFRSLDEAKQVMYSIYKPRFDWFSFEHFNFNIKEKSKELLKKRNDIIKDLIISRYDFVETNVYNDKYINFFKIKRTSKNKFLNRIPISSNNKKIDTLHCSPTFSTGGFLFKNAEKAKDILNRVKTYYTRDMPKRFRLTKEESDKEFNIVLFKVAIIYRKKLLLEKKKNKTKL